MKLNRLFEITSILLNRRTVTAAELAERFGVSVRTIYRDIDALSASGVPVYTSQGAGGGISLMEEYSLSRAMLSDEERRGILMALQLLRATRCPDLSGVLEKLGGLFRGGADWISVDFSPWDADPNAANRFADVRDAILARRVIEVEYINASNRRSTRQIEPLRLEFKQSAWYLWGWCRLRQELRSFRLSRIKRVTLTPEVFQREPGEALRRREEAEQAPGPTTHFVLRFDAAALYRLYDAYDDGQIVANGDGTYTVALDVNEDDWIYGYVLGFGEHVELLEPERARRELQRRARAIAGRYERPAEQKFPET